MCEEYIEFDENNIEHLDRTKYKVVKWDVSGRHPTGVTFCETFREDASRRDFSFNALALSASGEVIDYFNGISDLQNKIVKTIGCPYDRFDEDFLRILRLIRFAVKFDCEIEKCVFIAAQDCSIFIDKISIERIVNEIIKMAELGGEKFSRAIKLLDEIKILEKILPEISCLKELDHPLHYHPEGALAYKIVNGKISDEAEEYCANYHYDNEYKIVPGTVFDHVLEAIKLSKSNNAIVNFAVLFHDIGKKITVKKNAKGNNCFYNHDSEGAILFEKVSERLKLSTDMKNEIKFCIENHMRYGWILEMRHSKVINILNSPYFKTLEQVAYCDHFSKRYAANMGKWKEIQDKIESITNKWIKNEKNRDALDIYVNGNTVMKISKIKPGPKLGKIIKKTKEWIIDTGNTEISEINKKIIQLSELVLR